MVSLGLRLALDCTADIRFRVLTVSHALLQLREMEEIQAVARIDGHSPQKVSLRSCKVALPLRYGRHHQIRGVAALVSLISEHVHAVGKFGFVVRVGDHADRKSTRLNSS